MLSMGMEGSCTHTKEPLSSIDDGFVDPYLIGNWRKIEDETIPKLGELVYEVSVDPANTVLRIKNRKFRGGVEIYEGYSTQLNGKKYLNLKLVECLECDDQQTEDGFSNGCPYYIIQYETYISQKTLSLLFDASETEAMKEVVAFFSGWRGRLLFTHDMSSHYIANAIREGVIPGELSCDDCDTLDVCITADSETLRSFVEDHEARVYEGDIFYWRMLGRELPSDP